MAPVKTLTGEDIVSAFNQATCGKWSTSIVFDALRKGDTFEKTADKRKQYIVEGFSERDGAKVIHASCTTSRRNEKRMFYYNSVGRAEKKNFNWKNIRKYSLLHSEADP